MAEGDNIDLSHRAPSNIFENIPDCQEYDRSIFCVGTTGSGKSSFCTFLTRDQSFLAESNAKSKTKCARSGFLQFQNFKIMITDSPGFTNCDINNEEISGELCRAGILAKNGTDALAFLINVTEEIDDDCYLKGIEMLKSFGGNFWKHAFVIFTHDMDIINTTGYPSVIEFLNTLKKKNEYPEIYKNILTECDHRQMCIESVEQFHNNEYKMEKLSEIMAIIEQIRCANNGTRYKNYLMIHGDKLNNMRLKTQKETENLQQEINILEKDLQVEKEENTQLKTEIAQLKNEKLTLKKKFGDEIIDYQRNVADIRQKSLTDIESWYTVGISVLSVILAIKGIKIN